MDRYIIRKITMAHCKKGPEACPKCREMDSEKICLLDIQPPRPGEVQRRVIEVETGGRKRWLEYDIVRSFENGEEAREYAAKNGITDIEP